MSGNITDSEVEGLVSLLGRNWVRISSSNQTVWLPHRLFVGGSQAAFAALAESDFVILSGSQTKWLRDRVERLTFRPGALIETVGWTQGYSALPDGTVFSPPGAEPGIAVFTPDRRRCRARGRLPQWRRTVAAPLARNPLASFMIMQTMSAPLLRLVGKAENPIYGISGANGRGKSCLQGVMASVLGPVADPTSGRYQVSLATTAAGLEDYLEQHADLPMILDEENRLATGQARSRRSDAVLELVWQLSGIETKKRHKESRAAVTHTSFTISMNDQLDAASAGSARYSAATNDRFFAIEIDAEHGVFFPAPEPYGGPGEFADALIRAAEDNYGTAIRRFLERLVTLNAVDPLALRQRILDDMEQFRSEMRISANNGSARRAADAFGIVYAAGRLAREFGAIPRSYDPLWSSTRCFSMYLQQQSQALPDQRLAAFARRDDVLRWTGDLTSLSPAEAKNYVACVRTNRRGERELRIPPDVFNAAFSSPESLLTQAAAAGLLQRDKDSRRKKRAITPGGEQDWAYCFVRSAKQQQ